MAEKVILLWNGPKRRWDFPDCENMKLLFRPRKDRPNHYVLEIRRTEDGGMNGDHQ
jgi:hypothetical protein